jgi:hypothetical protein
MPDFPRRFAQRVYGHIQRWHRISSQAHPARYKRRNGKSRHSTKSGAQVEGLRHPAPVGGELTI